MLSSLISSLFQTCKRKILISVLGALILLPETNLFSAGSTGFIPLVSWELRRVSDDDRDKWIPARVPSTVAVSYRDAGLLDDIRYDDNALRVDDDWYVADFLYRTTFARPDFDRNGGRVILNFDGISWKADVSLNGKPLGRIEGSFIRSRFDVTDLIEDSNCLEVLIHRQANPGKVKVSTLERGLKNGGILGADNPCFHATIGWDWFLTVPGRNIGIWNDVFLSLADSGIVLEDAFFDTVLDKDADATVFPTITVNNFSGKTVEKTMEVEFGDIRIKQKVAAAPGRSDVRLEPFRIEKPELWWPNGYGEPHLYDVKVKFGKAEKSLRCGVRQMTYTLERSALQMYINGRRYIPKGGNWGFPDINLECTAREFGIALKFHRLMNFNMIRNWVGQTGHDELYDACDEAGVMIWQDFWLANPFDGPDPDDDGMFVRNADDMIHRVRGHACMALYCARNEGVPKRPLELHLNRLVSELCPNSLYIANSSEFLVSGQGPYHNLEPEGYFRNPAKAVKDIPVGDNKFHSERGAACIPSYESMCRMFRPEHRWPMNDVWALHNFTYDGAQKCKVLDNMITRGFGGEPASLKEYSDRAQYINYNTYRAMFESRSYRRNGLLMWMSHRAWPSTVFQTYDYWYDVNASVYACKKGCAPLRIQWNPVLGCVEVVNDSYGDLKGLQATVRYLDADGAELESDSCSLDVDDDSTVQLGNLKTVSASVLRPGQSIYYIRLTLTKDGRTLAENFYWEGAEQGVWTGIPLPETEMLRISWKAEDGCITATVTNTGSVVLPMVRVDLLSRVSRKGECTQVLPSFYEDNYFALLPGESRTVRIEYLTEEHRGESFTVSARYIR